jgi:uncharacterized pyridoxamine 5'-phosphate oxidase family protein
MIQKAFDFLREHKEIVLATSEDNIPKTRIFQIMKQEGHKLYFATSSQKEVYRQLQANPNIEVLAFFDNVSVRCAGVVNFEVDESTKKWVYENNPVLPRLYTSYDKLVYFCLPIAELDYYDLNPTPPVFKHFNLISGDIGDGYIGERFNNRSAT